MIDKILDIEQEMFLSVPTDDEPPCLVGCRENPAAFRGVRRASFKTWSIGTLNSYLGDLRDAKNRSVNLMTLKYAGMFDQIPCINDNPIIDAIVDIEAEWNREFLKKHPGIAREQKSDRAYKYLRGELETYSDRTLERYHSNLISAKSQGRNLVEETYRNMFALLGKEI